MFGCPIVHKHWFHSTLRLKEYISFVSKNSGTGRSYNFAPGTPQHFFHLCSSAAQLVKKNFLKNAKKCNFEQQNMYPGMHLQFYLCVFSRALSERNVLYSHKSIADTISGMLSIFLGFGHNPFWTRYLGWSLHKFQNKPINYHFQVHGQEYINTGHLWQPLKWRRSWKWIVPPK